MICVPIGRGRHAPTEEPMLARPGENTLFNIEFVPWVPGNSLQKTYAKEILRRGLGLRRAATLIEVLESAVASFQIRGRKKNEGGVEAKGKGSKTRASILDDVYF